MDIPSKKIITLRCNFGSCSSQMYIWGNLNNNKEFIENISGNKPTGNIMSFGMCSSLSNPTVCAATACSLGFLSPQPCVANIAFPWMSSQNGTVVKSDLPIDENSKTYCSYGGQITIESIE